MRRLLKKFILWIFQDEFPYRDIYYPISNSPFLEMKLILLEKELRQKLYTINRINQKTDQRIRAIITYIDNKLQ